MSHINGVIDADPHFEIDIVTRTIRNVSQAKTTLVQYDHNSERFSFTLPRYIEGHDMMECNKVQAHYINIDTKTKDVNSDAHDIKDLAICEEKPENVCCTWQIKETATQYAGILQFSLRFECVSEGGVVDYSWGTVPFTGISVSAGIKNSKAIVEEYSDVLEQWRQELFSASAKGVENIYTARAETMEGIRSARTSACETVEQKGQSVADSLPDDYMALSEKVKNVSNTLKGTAKSVGGIVSMHDVSPLEHMMSVKVRKKAASIPWSDVRIKKYGKNILDIANVPMYHCNANNPLYTWERTETGFKVKFVRTGNPAARHAVYIGTIDELKGKTITISAKFKGLGKHIVTLGCTEIDGTTVQSTEDPGYNRTIGYIGGSGMMPNLEINDKTATTDKNIMVSYKVPDTIPDTVPNPATYDRLAVGFYISLGDEITEDMIANNTAVTEWSDIQIEIGEGSPVSTEYVPYQEPVTYIPNENGTIEGVTSLYPTTILTMNASGIIDCEYNRDINKAYDELKQAILSLGNNI